jgi:diguanylate cyclase (GGDEF)-like protein
MTLYRQLALIIALLFVAGFIGTLTISTGNLQQFLTNQLASHAQDTATSLGLSLSQPMQDNDLPIMNSMVDAIFDRGYYHSIVVESADGESLVERSSTMDTRNVPGWFTRHIRLEVPQGDALVMSGWKQAATVTVSSHPGHAYRELWENMVDTFWLFFLSAVTMLLLGLAGIHFLLKPLRRVELQAEAICNREYAVQEKLPRTRELRIMVEAMNRLARKVNEIFTEQSSLTGRLREQAFRDPVTGLGNRHYFNRQLRNLVESPEEPAHGAVLLIELNHLDEINTTAGFRAGDRLLARAGELVTTRITDCDNCYCARTSGAGFGIVAVDISNTAADDLAAALAGDLVQLQIENLVKHMDVGSIGVATWQPGDTVTNVLAEVDIALQSARSGGENAWVRYEPPAGKQATPGGAHAWQEHLEQAIKDGQMILYTQDVVPPAASHDKLLHREVLLRTRDTGGGLLAAGVFMPMAERMGLATQLDRLTVNKALEQIARVAGSTRYAINLSSVTLHDPEFLAWLCNCLGRHPEHTARLVFELPEYGVLKNVNTARKFIRQLKDTTGCDCGIDHFGRGFSSFGYLRSIGVQYLKIDGSYTRDIDKDADNRFFVEALVDTAHSIDIKVIAEAVETAAELEVLEAMNVDGIQGYLAGKPEPFI